MKALKLLFLIVFPILFIIQPHIGLGQSYENKLLEINDILSGSKYRSSSMGTNSEYSYEFSLNYESNLVLTENLLQNDRLQSKTYIFTSIQMMTATPDIKVNDGYVTLQFTSMNYGAGNVYINYKQISNQGYRSSGLESIIYMYYDNLNSHESRELAKAIEDLFELFLSIDPEQPHGPITKTPEQPRQEKNKLFETTTSEREYYNSEKRRVYSYSDASYYRRVTYNSYGIPQGQVECYYVSGQIYFRGQLYETDKQNMVDDLYTGHCAWYYENGQKLKEGYYKFGEPNGTFKYWYESGEREAEVKFVDGLLDGPFVVYYENGIEKFKGEYIDGRLKDGIHIECDEEGLCEMVFRDNFDDNENDWPETNDENIYSIIEDGYYYLKSKAGSAYIRTINYPIDVDGAFIIGAQFYFKEGTDQYGHGLLWGYRNSANYHSFEISSDGYYCIKSCFDGIELDIAGWAKSDKIRQNQAWNKLQINKYGDKIYFIINGKIVHNTDFKGLRGHRHGIISRGKKSFFVDDFVIREYIFDGEDDRNRGSGRSEAWAGSGTGVIISTDGYILTNYHVVAESEEISVELYKNGIKNAYKAVLKTYDEDVDLALLKIEDVEFRPFYYIPYTINYTPIDVGSRVYALGYPMSSIIGDEIRFNEGTISSESGFRGDITTYQVSVPIQPGNSGSPLFDYNGNLVGIVSSKIMQADNISYAVKSRYIRNLLNKLYRAPSLSDYNTLQGSELTYQIRTLKEYVPIIKVR